jgi:hypothetical protein
VSAEAKILEHMAAAMDRILNPPAPKVRFEPHPLDFCDVCGAKDKYDSFATIFRTAARSRCAMTASATRRRTAVSATRRKLNATAATSPTTNR